MNIKILGTGCPNCLKLEANTRQALVELNMEAQVEKVTEIQEIMSYGVMSTPALVIDDEVVMAGQVPNVEKIKQIIIANKVQAVGTEDTANSGGCGCCGGQC
ncbi:MAG: thioredoxin family protein [Parcubacteria group bacterium]|jgi:small redox-active disulfide protein 2